MKKSIYILIFLIMITSVVGVKYIFEEQNYEYGSITDLEDLTLSGDFITDSARSYGGYNGESKDWGYLLKIYDYDHNTIHHIINTSSGEYKTACNMFCDTTFDGFTQSDADDVAFITVDSGTYAGIAGAFIRVFINSSCVKLEHNPSWDTNLSNLNFTIRDPPYIYSATRGLHHIIVNNQPTSRFQILATNATGTKTVNIKDTTNADSHTTMAIKTDATSAKDISVLDIFFDVSGASDIKNYIHSVYNTVIDAGDSGEGTLFVIDVSKQGSENFEASVIGAHKDIAIAFQIIGEFENISAGWIYDSSYTNATTAFQDTGVNITGFVNDGDYMYIGSSSWFTEVEISMAGLSCISILPVFEYYNGTGFEEFRPSDKTKGLTRNGLLTFNAFVLGGWTTSDVNGVNAYWIRIKRTESILQCPPVIKQIKVLGSGLELYYWDKLGNLAIKSVYTQQTDIVKDLTSVTEDYTAFDVSMSNKGSLHADVLKVTGDFDHIIHTGSSDIINRTYYDNTVSMSDITENMTNTSNSNVIFDVINGVLHVCSDDQFNRLGIILETIASHNIEDELWYCNGTDEYKQESTYSDSSLGFQRDGMYSWETSDDQTTCNVSLDGIAFDDTTPYYCVALKRTRGLVSTPPSVRQLSIAGSVSLFTLSDKEYKQSPTDSPTACDANNLGNEYFDLSEDFKCLCISTGYVRMDDTSACT